MKKKNIFTIAIAAILVIVMAVAFTACGDNKDKKPITTTEPTTKEVVSTTEKEEIPTIEDETTSEVKTTEEPETEIPVYTEGSGGNSGGSSGSSSSGGSSSGGNSHKPTPKPTEAPKPTPKPTEAPKPTPKPNKPDSYGHVVGETNSDGLEYVGSGVWFGDPGGGGEGDREDLDLGDGAFKPGEDHADE